MSRKTGALILTFDGVQDQEIVYPFFRLQEDFDDVHVMADKVGKKAIKGILGVPINVDLCVDELDDSNFYEQCLESYDLLVLPGGVKSLEKLRQHDLAVSFISDWNKRGKIIASTCHGAQLLISARAVRGRQISGYYSIRDDILNAGAEYVDAPVVVSDNIVSSPHYDHMAIWLKTAIDLCKKRSERYAG